MIVFLQEQNFINYMDDALKYIKEDLMNIHNIGLRIKKMLLDIGIHTMSDLKNKVPERLYEEVCKNTGIIQDRCLLYVFRMAIYYVNNDVHDEEKLKWNYWKDKENEHE